MFLRYTYTQYSKLLSLKNSGGPPQLTNAQFICSLNIPMFVWRHGVMDLVAAARLQASSIVWEHGSNTCKLFAEADHAVNWGGPVTIPYQQQLIHNELFAKWNVNLVDYKSTNFLILSIHHYNVK